MSSLDEKRARLSALRRERMSRAATRAGALELETSAGAAEDNVDTILAELLQGSARAECYTKDTQTDSYAEEPAVVAQPASARDAVATVFSPVPNKVDGRGDDPAASVGAPSPSATATAPLMSEAHARAVEQSEEFASFLRRGASLMERTLTRDAETGAWEAADSVDHLGGGASDAAADAAPSGALAALVCLEHTDLTAHRCVTDMHFSPRQPDVLACSYVRAGAPAAECDLDGAITLGASRYAPTAATGAGRTAGGAAHPLAACEGMVLLWSLQLSSRPEMVLHADSAVHCCRIAAPHTILAGCASGQLVLWDTRAGASPVQKSCVVAEPSSSTSSLRTPHGHALAVSALEVLGRSTSSPAHAVSVSSDGMLCSWDLCRLTQPIEVSVLRAAALPQRNAPAAGAHAGAGPAARLHASALAIAPAETARCAVGSDDGRIVHASRHAAAAGGAACRELCASRADDAGAGGAPAARAAAHGAAVSSLHFHPHPRQLRLGSGGVADLLLSSSTDSAVRLWACERAGPPSAPLATLPCSEAVFDARWHPHRLPLLAAADASGCVALWNLASDVEAPAATRSLGAEACSRLSWAADGRMLAVGTIAGGVRVERLAAEVAEPQPDDARSMERLMMSECLIK